jgi:serine/threonine protein phosphatase PrpC
MLDQLSACPSCFEPLEQGDRFCGVCGADLTAAARHVSPVPEGSPGTAGQPAAAPAPPAAAAPAPAPAPASTPTPTEPDFTLAPAEGLPEQPEPYEQNAPNTQSAQNSPNTQSTDDAQAQPAPPSGQPHTAQPEHAMTAEPSAPATTDPRTSDPRVMLDDSPPAEPPPTMPESIHMGTAGKGLRALIDGEEPPPVTTKATSPTPTLPDNQAAVPRCVACGTGAVDGDGYCQHCGHKQPSERDHMESELASVAAASDRGLRHHRNEDYFALVEAATPEGSPVTIAVVCDGVSSATRPDDASAAAARTASASLRDAVQSGSLAPQAMHNALIDAAEAVNALAAEGPNEPSKNAPACTIVSAVTADGILTVGWIGDSRAYWVPEDRTAPAARLTEDDSWAAQMVAAGLMNEEEAYADARAHAITGWLGADAYEIEPHTASFKPDRAGVVVVCTDGLWNYAEAADQMAAAVPPDARTRPLHSARRLVGYALDGGGHDNVTVAVVPCPAPTGGAGSA